MLKIPDRLRDQGPLNMQSFPIHVIRLQMQRVPREWVCGACPPGTSYRQQRALGLRAPRVTSEAWSMGELGSVGSFSGSNHAFAGASLKAKSGHEHWRG